MDQYGDEYDGNEMEYQMEGIGYGGPLPLLGENELLRTEFAVMTMMIVAMCCAVGCVIGVVTGFVSYGIMDKTQESTGADPDKERADEQNG